MAQKQLIEVSGMACVGCERTVENAMQNLDGIHRIEADHEAGTVEIVVENTVSKEDFYTVIHDAGYDVAT